MTYVHTVGGSRDHPRINAEISSIMDLTVTLTEVVTAKTSDRSRVLDTVRKLTLFVMPVLKIKNGLYKRHTQWSSKIRPKYLLK